ncbi:MAG: response regulator [Gemmatimonadota bacterium]
MQKETESIRLLLVDDEKDFRDAAGQALRRQGFHVSEAESGERALELIPSDRPNIVILDLKMGGMDGITTLEQIRRVDSDLPVLILTGHGRYEHALAGIQLGVVDFVQKPVEMEFLGTRIRELVRGGKRPLREKGLEELMVPASLYRRIDVESTIRDAVVAFQEIQRRELLSGDTDRGRRTLVAFDRQGRFKGLLRAEDIIRMTVPSFLAESPYSSYFTGMFLAQAKVVGRIPLTEVLLNPPTLDADAPLMEAAYWLVSRGLSHLAIFRDGDLVGILRPEDLLGEIANLSMPE